MAANYTVTGQEEVLDIGTQGTPVRMVQVAFKTLPHEVSGTIRVPLADFSAERVATLLEAAAAEREAVASL